ncbi:MAG: hypothetical protein IJL91_06865 [Bacteroidales bacterium]|nr:hypothetical protein [Bacteroidales bacterium]
MSNWIPIDERLPEVNEDGFSEYILLSFSNFSVPQVGRYEEDTNGGAFYLGDEEEPLSKIGVFVNAWMPLPECYKEDE